MELWPAESNFKCLPPADTRLVEIKAEPYPDGKRLRVMLTMTPFQKKPYLELNPIDTMDAIVATTSIVEPATTKLELTMHIRKLLIGAINPFTLSTTLYYPEIGEVDHRLLSIVLPTPLQ